MKLTVVELVTYLHISDFKTQQCRGKYLKDKKELTQNKQEKQKNLNILINRTISNNTIDVIISKLYSYINIARKNDFQLKRKDITIPNQPSEYGLVILNLNWKSIFSS